MDIIQHLRRIITPVVINEQTQTHLNTETSTKDDLLDEFYVLMCARLSDPQVAGRFENEAIAADDKTFFTRLWRDEQQVDHDHQVVEELADAHKQNPEVVRPILVAAAPLIYNEIKSLAGDTPVAQFLQSNSSSFKDKLPAWVFALLPAGLFATAATTAAATPVDHKKTVPAAHAAVPVNSEPEKKGFMKALLPIIGLIILGALIWALMRGCQDSSTEPTTAVTPVAEETADAPVAAVDNANLAPAELSLSVDETGENLYACRGTAGDQGLVDGIIMAMDGVFGTASDQCQFDINDAVSTDMPVLDKLQDVAALMKGVPSASATIVGNQILFNAPDAAARDQLIADTQALLPSFDVSAEPDLDIDTAVGESITASQAALDNMAADADVTDLVRALNMQIINFAVDEAVIPEQNTAILDKAAELLTTLPDARLMIVGHTDVTASDEYNMQLSEERAQSVKDYLVSQGVDESRLMTEGKGSQEPIADNSTESGRFRNRRIEFAVMTDNPDMVDVETGETVEVVGLPTDEAAPADESENNLPPADEPAAQ